MATHSSTLAWKIPWTEEPDKLQSRGSLRVGHDWATSLSTYRQNPSIIFSNMIKEDHWKLLKFPMDNTKGHTGQGTKNPFPVKYF